MDDEQTTGTGLDGNAAAGLLEAAFGDEMTTARGRCSTCGSALVLGAVACFTGGPGTVLRCRVCTAVLVVLIERNDVVCVDVPGVVGLEVPGAPPGGATR